jgi:RsiW-degrading membrane proteinase PrsW (M82 family)
MAFLIMTLVLLTLDLKPGIAKLRVVLINLPLLTLTKLVMNSSPFTLLLIFLFHSFLCTLRLPLSLTAHLLPKKLSMLSILFVVVALLSLVAFVPKISSAGKPIPLTLVLGILFLTLSIVSLLQALCHKFVRTRFLL